jgi:siroheme synthase-like protein
MKMTGRKALVVGGGVVAARKTAYLLRAGAQVTVVAPELGPDLARMVADSGDRLTYEPRLFNESDAEGSLLVVAATDDGEANRLAAAAGRARAALVNVVDDPDLSDVLIPSVLERGALQVAVGTSGRAPALAASVRRHLEGLFTQEWAEVIEMYGEVRDRLLAPSGPDPQARRKANRRLAQLDVFGLLARGGGPTEIPRRMTP